MLFCMTAVVAQPWPKGVYEVGSLERFKEVISHRMTSDDKCIAEIKLTADIYLNDCPELCRTFTGTLDGNGYTIYAGDENAHHDGRGFAHGKYLFTYSEGATFKNLTFKDFRADTDEHSNWSFLTSQASDGCVFENITFDHVSLWAKVDNGGAVAGYANGCTFRNITVKNGDFTVSRNSAGTVVGHATSCTFTNIEVSNCDATSETDHAGGVVGHSNNCTFTDIKVHDCNITAHHIEAGGVAGIAENNSIFTNIEVHDNEVSASPSSAGGVAGSSYGCTFTDINVCGGYFRTTVRCVGGVVGYAKNTTLTNCKVDDQVCIHADDTNNDIVWGDHAQTAGGIVGKASGGSFKNCINSAIVAGGQGTGGIVGDFQYESGDGKGEIIDCLNTGLVLHAAKDCSGRLFEPYRNKLMPCVTRYYNGESYDVRSFRDMDDAKEVSPDHIIIGGIAGKAVNVNISRCTNFGSVYTKSNYAAGIAGQSKDCNFVDCLTDFAYGDFYYDEYNKGLITISMYGISEDASSCKMTNCLNMVNVKMDNGSFTNNNNYTRGPSKSGVSSVTETQVAIGEICTKLGSAWEQNIGTDPCPTPTGDKGVYHSRNVKNTYGTVCLPFAVKSNDKVRFYLLDNVNNGDETVTVGFKYVETVEAGHPALFSVAEQGDVTFTPADDKWADQPYSHATGNDWHFVGTYKATVFEGENAKSIYYVSGDMIHNAKKTTIAPFRAYFEGPDINSLIGTGSQAKSIQFILEDGNGETTALESVGCDLVPVQKNSKTYSLMGTEVNHNYRGIVIRNGKKMIQNR